MPPLSPYTLTFAGYSIRAGSLWLDVRYVINDGELAGTNDVIIEALFHRLVQTQPLPTAQRDLAVQRAQVITRYLGSREIPPGRVRPAAPTEVEATEDSVPTEMRPPGG
jgi:hypothetical protein